MRNLILSAIGFAIGIGLIAMSYEASVGPYGASVDPKYLVPDVAISIVTGAFLAKAIKAFLR